MPLPVNTTLILQGQPRPGDVLQSHTKPKQAMLIRMSAETFEAMADLQNSPKLQFEFGDKPGLFVGNTFYPVKANSESPHHELYLRLSSAQKPMAPLKFYANVVGKFMVERQLGNKVEETVRDRTIEAEKQRTERKTVFLDGPPNLKVPGSKKKKDSTVRRPPPQSSTSAPPVPKLPPLPASTSHPNGLSSEVPPTRARLIHCLALKPRTTDGVILMCLGREPTGRMKNELMDLLQTVAEPVPVAKTSDQDAPQRWRLKLESWREVRPYQWPTLMEQERRKLSQQACKAFRDMKIPETDPMWDHVRYRIESDQAPGIAGKSNAGPSGLTGERNGVMSKNVKKKTGEGTRKRVSDILIPSKDESGGGKGKAREIDQESAAGTPTATRPPARRLPGSGFKAIHCATTPISDLRANSPVPKREPPASPGPACVTKASPPQEPRPAPVAAVASQNRKKARDSQGSSGTQRITERRKEDPPQPRDPAIGEKLGLKDRASPMPATLPSFKRKKPPQDGNDSDQSEGELPLSAGMPKKRKLDSRPIPAERSRVKDPSLPKKPVVREPSPVAISRVKIKKETSPFPSAFSPPPPSSVRSSIPPRALTVEKQNAPHSSSTRSPQPSQSQRSSGKGRRRSPIYTSSEDESEASVPVRHARVSIQAHSPSDESPTKRHKTAIYLQRFKPRPLPSDRGGLRKYYSSCYEVYYRLYSERSQRRNRIERMLRESDGEERERVEESDDDIDMDQLTPETLIALMDELDMVTKELKKVRQTWERLGGKVDQSGELVDE